MISGKASLVSIKNPTIVEIIEEYFKINYLKFNCIFVFKIPDNKAIESLTLYEL